MRVAKAFRQTGIVGPWRPAFFLSMFMLILTISVIYWNENSEGTKFCQAPGFETQAPTIVVMTVGATVGHFIVQLADAFSKYESNKHSSASMMVVLITGIQAASQLAMVSNIVTTSCEDYFGVRTSVFLWVEWMATVPIMFYLTTIMDTNKFKLTKEDNLVIGSSTLGLFCLYLLSFGTVGPIGAVFLMIMANVLMTSALFWLHGSSYFAHVAAVYKLKKFPDKAGPLSDLYVSLKQRKLLCAGFMNYFFTLFPVAYYLKYANVIDHETFYISFGILNFLCKGIFAALVTDSHSELLDPKTFLLFSEKERMEGLRRSFMLQVAEEVHAPLKSLSIGLKLLNGSDNICEADASSINMVNDASDLLQETLNDVLAIKRAPDTDLKLNMRPLYIIDVVNQAKETFKRQFAAKGLQEDYTVTRDAPLIVLGDRTLLDEILLILIRNAVRYSDRGDTVQVCISLDPKVIGAVRFSVKDSGPGIPGAARKTLFKCEGTKSFGCASKVALHGGTIGYDSPVSSVGAGASKSTSSSGSGSGSEKPGSEFYFSVNLEEVEEGDDDDY